MTTEHWEYPHNLPDGIEYFDSDEELNAALEKISSAIGWIVIEFNALEDLVVFNIKEIVSISEGRDSFVCALIANMQFNARTKALINLYGELVERCEIHKLRDPLKKLEDRLEEAARRRNIYVHANWAEISKQHLVSVKISAKRTGVRQIYRTFKPEEIESDFQFIQETSESLEEFDELLKEELNAKSA